MLTTIKKLLFGTKTDFKALMQGDAIIIDVRTKGEFIGGHIKGSKNIPLQVLDLELKKIAKNKTIITCCASGMRSASARKLLLAKGFTEVYNGGSWMRLNSQLN